MFFQIGFSRAKKDQRYWSNFIQKTAEFIIIFYKHQNQIKLQLNVYQRIRAKVLDILNGKGYDLNQMIELKKN